MIYDKEDAHVQACKFCESERFQNGNGYNQRSPVVKMHNMPLISRLQRLYALKKNAEHMIWHKNHVQQGAVITHPYEAEAWRNFDKTHASFAMEPCNVRLGLCVDGFLLYSNAAGLCSIWSIVVCVYNLPLHMRVTGPYILL